jgi:hypothetical protein
MDGFMVNRLQDEEGGEERRYFLVCNRRSTRETATHAGGFHKPTEIAVKAAV